MRKILNAYAEIGKTIYNNKFATFISIVWLYLIVAISHIQFDGENKNVYLMAAVAFCLAYLMVFGFLSVFKVYQDKEPGIGSLTGLFRMNTIMIACIGSILFLLIAWGVAKIVPELFNFNGAISAYTSIHYQVAMGGITTEESIALLENNAEIKAYTENLYRMSIPSILSAIAFAVFGLLLLISSMAFAFGIAVRERGEKAFNAIYRSLDISLANKSVVLFVIIPLLVLLFISYSFPYITPVFSLLLIVAIHNQIK